MHAEFPSPLAVTLVAGLRRLIDYQDVDYAVVYLDRLARLCRQDFLAQQYRLSDVAARGLALWMSFEDTIRVADLKTRGERAERIRQTVRGSPTDLMRVTEFLKPRVEEICETLPPRLGRFVERSPRTRQLLLRFLGDRRTSTSTITGFLQLRAVAGLTRWRRHTLRFAREHARIEAWLEEIHAAMEQDYDLAVEIAECQQLIRGYGDTHARGLLHFEQLMTAARPIATRTGAAQQLRLWREAALQDEDGAALMKALAAGSSPVSENRAP